MCLLVPALLIMNMQTGSSVLNEPRFLSEMALLFKTRRSLWSLPGFPAYLCDGKIVQCCALEGSVAPLKCCGWAGCWVISLANNTLGVAGIWSAGGTGSKVLPVQQLWPSSVLLQHLHSDCGNCFTSPWSAFSLWSTHITHEQSCVSPLQSIERVESKFYLSRQQFCLSQEVWQGALSHMSPAPLLCSGCLFFPNPFNDRRCNQGAAETWLHNCCQGFSLAALPCVLFAHWLSGTHGFSINQITPESDLGRWFVVVGLFLNTF